MTKRRNIWSRIAKRFALLLLATGVGSCSGGGSGLAALSVALFNFAPGFAGVHMNAPLVVTFTAPIDAQSVTQDSLRIFTITTTQQQQDPGAPARGEIVVSGNVLRFVPQIPQIIDPLLMLTDTGLQIGFTYTIQIPAAPNVIEPIRTIEGRPNLVSFTEFFTTINQTILPAPGDIAAEPNLNTLSQFFIDEGIQNGFDPCPREDLPPADQDSPQVIFSDPAEGESGFGTITGIQVGLGTAFVRLDPITLEFSEPVGPWRIRPQNITIRNTNLGGETFDLFFFFIQDRQVSRLQITVFDADSAFDQASVPQGRYVLALTEFTDLAGNPLVNSNTCLADGTFQLSFSTVSSPSLPTDLLLAFEDDDQEGHVDVGGLPTAANDPNELPEHVAPFLGGFAVDQDGVTPPSPSNQTSSANWGNTAFWTGCEVLYDNGFRPGDPGFQIPDAVRLRGGTFTGATPIMAPVAGNASGPSDTVSGSQDGIVPDPVEAGKVNFSLTGAQTATLFTGNAGTGPIVYHYNRFDMTADLGGNVPTVTYRSDSVFPMVIFVEDEACIVGNILCDGEDGEFGFNGDNGFAAPARGRQGGLGGIGGPGGGDGGDAGGSRNAGAPDASDPELLNGQDGGVPANVFGPLDGLAGIVTGGGGHFDQTQLVLHPVFGALSKDTDADFIPDVFPVYSGGGGGGTSGPGTPGGDNDSATPGETDQGSGGLRIGTLDTFGEAGIFASGGAGGGGGGADDDGGSLPPDEIGTDANLLGDNSDDGGGGGGGGGGFFGLACGGDVKLGEIDDTDPDNIIIRLATIRCVGGRGGSTYDVVSGDPPVPGGDPDNPDPMSAVGQGEAGGGGGGGGICIVSCGQVTVNAAECYALGKRGGNAPSIEAGGRAVLDEGGSGGGGKTIFSDVDGFGPEDLPAEIGGSNILFFLTPDTGRDLDGDGMPDLVAGDPDDDIILLDFSEMTGTNIATFDIYGDDSSEAKFGITYIVTEFFDTLSDSVSYDEVTVLSNAARSTEFPYSAANQGAPSFFATGGRTMRIFVDVTSAGPGGLPNLSAENADGSLAQPESFTLEAGTHFNGIPPQDVGDPPIGFDLGVPQFQSRFIIPANSPALGKRFVRVRICFDLTQISTDRDVLLASFAPAGAPLLPIADDPNTPDPENTFGNLDTAPTGVPAIAEVRVRFTP